MKQDTPTEILINATHLQQSTSGEVYEFIFNEKLQVVECVKIESLSRGLVWLVTDFLSDLEHELFELNHVRVNPQVDNTEIMNRLKSELTGIGVNIKNQPHPAMMEMCFKPLGEITHQVRFHFDKNGNTTFLTPQAKLSVIPSHRPKLV